MDSRDTYEESYEYINKLSTQNMTDVITIDYKKLDEISRGELRSAINKVCVKRKREIYGNILCGPHSY